MVSSSSGKIAVRGVLETPKGLTWGAADERQSVLHLGFVWDTFWPSDTVSSCIWPSFPTLVISISEGERVHKDWYTPVTIVRSSAGLYNIWAIKLAKVPLTDALNMNLRASCYFAQQHFIIIRVDCLECKNIGFILCQIEILRRYGLKDVSNLEDNCIGIVIEPFHVRNGGDWINEEIFEVPVPISKCLKHTEPC